MLKRCNFWVSPEQYLTTHYWKSPLKFLVSNKTCPDMTSQYGRIDFKIIVISNNLFFITKDTKRHHIPEDAKKVNDFIQILIEYLEDSRSRAQFNLRPIRKKVSSHIPRNSLFEEDPFKNVQKDDTSPSRIYYESYVLPEVKKRHSRKVKETKMRKSIQCRIKEDLNVYFEEKECLSQLKKTSESVIDNILESIVEECKSKPLHPSLTNNETCEESKTILEQSEDHPRVSEPELQPESEYPSLIDEENKKQDIPEEQFEMLYTATDSAVTADTATTEPPSASQISDTRVSDTRVSDTRAISPYPNTKKMCIMF